MDWLLCSLVINDIVNISIMWRSFKQGAWKVSKSEKSRCNSITRGSQIFYILMSYIQSNFFSMHIMFSPIHILQYLLLTKMYFYYLLCFLKCLYIVIKQIGNYISDSNSISSILLYLHWRDWKTTKNKILWTLKWCNKKWPKQALWKALQPCRTFN